MNRFEGSAGIPNGGASEAELAKLASATQDMTNALERLRGEVTDIRAKLSQPLWREHVALSDDTTAGGAYTAAEQDMLQEAYDLARDLLTRFQRQTLLD